MTWGTGVIHARNIDVGCRSRQAEYRILIINIVSSAHIVISPFEKEEYRHHSKSLPNLSGPAATN